MSYARFGPKSDVYVFADVDRFLCCCECGLPGTTTEKYYSTAAMLEHLEAHRAAGHMVPEYCVDGLKLDAAKNDAWILVPA